MIADNIRKLCKERGISVTVLEEKLGFGNGSLTKGTTLRSDRLKMVADFFGVTTDYILNGDVGEGYYMDSEAAKMMQKLFDSPGRKALFEAVADMDEEMVQRYADFIKGVTNDNNKADGLS